MARSGARASRVSAAAAIPLDRQGGVPLFLQVKRHFERLIAGGALSPATRLPASRDLARALGLSRTTVATAYDLLIAEGWARAHVGQGTFVAARPGEAGPPAGGPVEDGLAWEVSLSRSAREVLDDARRRRGLDPAGAAPGLISFVGASPDPTLFPTEAFRRAVNHVIRREGGRLLEYHPVAGYGPLRRYLAEWLGRHGIETREDEVVVVNGSQQGLDLIARVLVDPGDAVVVEQPTYPGALQTFAAAQARIVAAPLGPAGLSAEVVARLLERHRPKLLYCQPSGQNPTGLSMSAPERAALLALAARHRVPIVEDGFGAPGEGVGAPLPLRALDRHGLVIHLGTFSKILFPGLRVGWMVVPRALVEPVVGVKQLADLSTGALLQAALYRFCQGRRFERHAEAVRAEYGRRRTVLLDALARAFPREVTWTVPDDSAVSLLVTLPEGLDAGELLPRAVARGVAYVPGRFFVAAGAGGPVGPAAATLRLAYAALPAPRIEDGVRRLAVAVGDALGRRRRRADTPPAALSPAAPLV